MGPISAAIFSQAGALSSRRSFPKCVIHGILPPHLYTDVVQKNPDWIYALECDLLTQDVIDISAKAGVDLDVLYEKMNKPSKKRLHATPKAP